MFEQALHALDELGGIEAINHAVIERRGKIHHLANDDSATPHHRTLDDRVGPEHKMLLSKVAHRSMSLTGDTLMLFVKWIVVCECALFNFRGVETKVLSAQT